jgi:hypothetical protein
MKHVFIFGSMLLFTVTTAFSQDELAFYTASNNTSHKITKSQREENRAIRREKALTEPTYMAEQNFETDFPNATNVTWKKIGIEEASFTLNGKEI